VGVFSSRRGRLRDDLFSRDLVTPDDRSSACTPPECITLSARPNGRRDKPFSPLFDRYPFLHKEMFHFFARRIGTASFRSFGTSSLCAYEIALSETSRLQNSVCSGYPSRLILAITSNVCSHKDLFHFIKLYRVCT